MSHERTTVDQFTRQAAGFSSAAAMNDAARSAAPEPDAVRAVYDAAIDHGETLGIGERRADGRVRFEFPIAVVTGDRDA